MVQYYYDKYNAIITNNYTEPNWNNDDSIVDVFFKGRERVIPGILATEHGH